MSDLLFMLSATAASCIAVGALGMLVLRALRRRSVVLSLIVCALVPVVAVIVAVQVNVRAMFLSEHDAEVITIVSSTAGVLAVLTAVVLGRRLVAGSRMVRHDLLRLTEVYDGPEDDGSDDGAWPERSGRAQRRAAPVSAEIAELTAQLDDVRRRLEESRRREHTLEAGRRDLLAAMSHDLRTPLAGLRALAEGLEDDLLPDPGEAYRQIRASVERMAAMVDDLFEVARLQALPAIPAQRSGALVSLREIVEDVVAEARPAARAKGVSLGGAVTGRLPVRGDGDELARALSNLVANAVRHTSSGGKVQVTGGEAGKMVVVGVADGCGGIRRDDLERVFEVGWRGDPERTPGSDGGAGLGLAIVRGVAESHSGAVTVRNAGAGCRFELTLPSATT